MNKHATEDHSINIYDQCFVTYVCRLEFQGHSHLSVSHQFVPLGYWHQEKARSILPYHGTKRKGQESVF